MNKKKPTGRPPKVNIRVMKKIADAISHNYPVSDAVRHGKISRSTYYHYMNNDPLFEEIMRAAKSNQDKVSFNFRTVP